MINKTRKRNLIAEERDRQRRRDSYMDDPEMDKANPLIFSGAPMISVQFRDYKQKKTRR